MPYATAYRALFLRGYAKAGETVLIHGASGGVGTAAVQLARAFGMNIIGTAGTEKGLELVRQQGAQQQQAQRTQQQQAAQQSLKAQRRAERQQQMVQTQQRQQAAQAQAAQQRQQMKQQIGALGDEMTAIVLHRGDHGFHRFLAELFGAMLRSLVQQLAGIGRVAPRRRATEALPTTAFSKKFRGLHP